MTSFSVFFEKPRSSYRFQNRNFYCEDEWPRAEGGFSQEMRARKIKNPQSFDLWVLLVSIVYPTSTLRGD